MRALLAAAAGIFAATACEFGPRVATRDAAESNDSIVGEWLGQDGRRIVITDRLGPDYGVEIIPAEGEPEKLDGRLATVDGRQFIEIGVNDPDGDEAPVYHYGLVSTTGSTLTHQALDPAWAERYCTGEGRGRAFMTTTERGRALVGCASPEAMRDMLAAALHDANAFRPAETLTRAD